MTIYEHFMQDSFDAIVEMIADKTVSMHDTGLDANDPLAEIAFAFAGMLNDICPEDCGCLNGHVCTLDTTYGSVCKYYDSRKEAVKKKISEWFNSEWED